MKIVAIIQARMGSQRLPAKSMMEILDKPLLWYVLERVKKSELINSIILATSTNSENDVLCELAKELGVEILRGSELDVLSRYVNAGKIANADIIVRICADNPLVDPGEIDRIIKHHITEGCDYSFNHIPTKDNNYPDGLGAEVINASVLYGISCLSLSSEEREHVTLYITDNSDEYVIGSCTAPIDVIGPDIKLDIDTSDDFKRMKGFIEYLPKGNAPYWTAAEIVQNHRLLFNEKVIVLLSTEEEVSLFCNHFKNQSSPYIPILTSPCALWEFEKRGLHADKIDRFFCAQEIYSIGIDNYQKLEDICLIFDNILSKIDPNILKYNINLTQYNFYALKYLIDNLTTKIRLLNRMISSYHPNLIISFSKKHYMISELINNPGQPSIDFNYYSHILNLNGWPCKTAIYIICSENCLKKSTNSDLKQNIGQLFSKKNLYSIINIMKIGNRNRFYALLIDIFSQLPIGKSQKKCIFDFYLSYDWIDLSKNLWKEGYFFHHVHSNIKNIKENNYQFNQVFKPTKKEINKYCVFDSINFSDILFSTIQSLLKKQIILIPGLILSIEHEIYYCNPIAFVSVPKTEVKDYIITCIIQYHDIPVITWQHGGYGHHDAPIIYYSSYQNSNFHYNWGNGVLKTMHRNSFNKFPCYDISIGSYKLQQLFKDQHKKRIHHKILYLSSSFYQNTFYVSYPLPFHDNQLWMVQKGIFDLLGECNCTTVFKVHPNQNEKIFIEYLNKRSLQNIKLIKYETTTIELIQRSEIIVIDLPTTVLLQSIAAKKIIFVLLKFIKLTDDALILLKKRVYYAYSIEELSNMIKNYLNNVPIDQHPDILNTEFLEQYGIFSKEGTVEERIISEIKKIKYNVSDVSDTRLQQVLPE